MVENVPVSKSLPGFTPPHPGSSLMPRWDGGELPHPPVFSWRHIAAFVGPGLVAGASAIGAGEWLNGPMVCARYGGSMLWLATLSILGQVVYNLEVSRYTLYTGESIFTGKFRTLPGPLFWLLIYLVLDFGTIFPYLAASAGTPIYCIFNGHMPDPKNVADKQLLEYISFGVFLLAIVPLLFGGKVYNSIRSLMTFKIFSVLGFLTILALFYSNASTWTEIGSGFLKFGSLPVMTATAADGSSLAVSAGESYPTENIFVNWWQGKPLPELDLSMMAILGAMAALAGNGGLTNTNVSGYTRDQGWGMGRHVGAIPSVVGGHSVKLSHVGMVFPLTDDNRRKFSGWYRHVFRDQFFLFGIASFIGLAMPSMLSVQFLPRGTESDPWTAAGMTADGVYNAIGPHVFKQIGWFMTLFCGFLVLALSTTTTADGYFRRWIDVLWTGLPAMRSWKPHSVGKLYFAFLCTYCCVGLSILAFVPQGMIMKVATNIYNYALGISCLHVLYVNLALLPRELRPNWFVRIGLVLAAVFFTGIAVITTLQLVRTLYG
jgi:hypothetical protein